MQLKRLEIQGFKSFADKTVLEFGPGITAIVGPNGCGKTNILDSIRWVLGEQSSKLLRCDRMENVIFNGSENRKAVGRASVSMTLVNNRGVLPIEYDEITIKRELFRSGESNYYINKTACRLKDITDLFMDTGLGSHVYSIIEQSQVDLILSNKPALRRMLFEEAAGISKFKNRKEIALKKLEGTSQNLERLSDIVSEVTTQRNSLKRQANKASRYQDLKDEVMKLEGLIYKYEQFLLQEEWQTCQKKIAAQELELTSQNAALSETETNLEQNKLKLIERETIIKKQATALAEKKLAYEKIENGIVLKREKISALQRQDIASREEISSRENRLKELRERMLAEESEFETAKAALAGKNDDLKTLNDELAKQRVKLKSQEAVSGAQEKRLNELKARKNKISNNLTSFSVQSEYLVTEIKRAQEQIGIKKIRLADSARELQVKEKELRTAVEEQDKRKVQLKAAQEQRSELEKKLENKRLERAEVENRYTENHSLIKALEELHLRRHGFFAGVKAALQLKEDNRENGNGILGVIADLVTTDERYRLALETAAGANIQNIVTETAEVAKRTIEYLKKEQKGRATFLPLDLVENKERKIKPGLLKENGVIAPAWELIKVEPRYQRLVSLIWGRTLVVDNLTNAIRIAKRNPDSAILVTLEGELVKRGGSITGGYQGGEKTGLLMREGRIESLKESNERLRITIEAFLEEERQLRESRDLASREVERLEAQYREQELVINNQRHAANVVDAESKRLTEEIEFTVAEIEQKNSAKERIGLDSRNLEAEHKSLEEEISGLTKTVADLQGANLALREEIDQAAGDVTALKVELAAFFEREKNLNRKKADLEHQEALLNQEIKDRETNKIASLAEQKVLVAAIAEDEASLKELSRELKKIESGQVQQENIRQEFLSAIEAREKRCKDLRVLITELRSQLNEVVIEKTRLEVELKAITDKLNNYEYLKIELETGEEFDLSAGKNKIEQLREKIARLEPVNLAALEEFNEIDKRYQFLTGQVKDLEDAKRSLATTINQINQTSEARFRETFKIIQDNFAHLFTRFFGGGQTALVLSDPGKPLESGIEIIAQPRGKRPQSITQLSGGERALTAIALVFAIFMVKPSPFCILDEVDAPLDENNVLRYAELIRDFTHSSQFLTITHSKRTMEAAQTLYGVTMEEVGVSKIISMRLQEEEQPTLDLLEVSS